MKAKSHFNKPLYLILLGFVFIIICTYFVYYSLDQAQQQKDELTTNEIHVNNNEQQWRLTTPGKSILEYVSNPGDGPRIVKSVIEPLHVNAGERQNIQLEINSEYNVENVTAYITTDKGLFEIKLNQASVREQTFDDFKNQTAYTDNKGNVNLNVKTDNNPKAALNGFVDSLFTKAKATNELRFIYTGSWTVADSRNKSYFIRFVVNDENKKSDKVALAWSNPCTLPVTKEITKWPTEASKDTMGYFSSDKEFNITNDSVCSDNKIANVENANIKITNNKTLVVPSKDFINNSGNSIVLEEKSKIAIPIK